MSKFRLMLAKLPVSSGPPPTGLAPSATWNGTANSGFAALPVDPPRAVAKPRARLLNVPFLQFDSAFDLVVHASAKGGIQKVIFHLEGTSQEVTTRTWSTYTDTNGLTKTLYGYTAPVDYAAWLARNGTGTAHLYIEVVPSSPTYQNRVLGPFKYYARSTANLYDYQVQIAPSQSEVTDVRYQNFKNAANRARAVGANFARFTYAESGEQVFSVPTTSRSNANSFYTIDTAPGVEIRPRLGLKTGGTAMTAMELAFDGLRWVGAGIVWEWDRLVQYTYAIASNPLFCFDGVNFTAEGGRNFQGAQEVLSTFVRDRRSYAVDCIVADTHLGLSWFEMVRRNSLDKLSSDACAHNGCAWGNFIRDVNPSADNPPDDVGLRTAIPALSGDGPSGATVTVTGTGGGSIENRTMTLAVSGVTVDTIALDSSKTFAQVASEWNANAGWAATVIDNTRPANWISIAGTLPAGTMPSNIDVSSGATFLAVGDIHADIGQYDGYEAALMSTVTIKARIAGTAGNAIPLAEASSAITVSGATLSGGGAGVPATGQVVISTNPANNDPMTLGSVTYTFKTTPSAPNDVLIASGREGTLTNLFFAMRSNPDVYPEHITILENRVFAFNDIWGIGESQGIHINGGGRVALRDCDFSMNLFHLPSGISNTNWFENQEHVAWDDNTAPGHTLLLRNAQATGAQDAYYRPDEHCTIYRSWCYGIVWTYSANASENVDIDGCKVTQGSSAPPTSSNSAGLSKANNRTGWLDLIVDPPQIGDGLGDFNCGPIPEGPLKITTGPNAGSYAGAFAVGGARKALV